MVLSAYEQRHWRQLEQQLAGDRRLVALAAKFDRVGRPRPLRWLLLALAAASVALAVLAAGAVTDRSIMIEVGVGFLFFGPLLVSVLAIRRFRRRRPRPPR